MEICGGLKKLAPWCWGWRIAALTSPMPLRRCTMVRLWRMRRTSRTAGATWATTGQSRIGMMLATTTMAMTCLGTMTAGMNNPGMMTNGTTMTATMTRRMMYGMKLDGKMKKLTMKKNPEKIRRWPRSSTRAKGSTVLRLWAWGVPFVDPNGTTPTIAPCKEVERLVLVLPRPMDHQGKASTRARAKEKERAMVRKEKAKAGALHLAKALARKAIG